MTHFDTNPVIFWYNFKYIYFLPFLVQNSTILVQIYTFYVYFSIKYISIPKTVGFISKCVMTYPKSVEDMSRHVGDVFEDVRDVSE